MRSLCACLQSEVNELRECQRLLNEITAAETTERSLAVGRMQLGKGVRADLVERINRVGFDF